MMAGFVFNPRMIASKWSATCPTVLPANTSFPAVGESCSRPASKAVDQVEQYGRLRVGDAIALFEHVSVRMIHAQVRSHQHARREADLGRDGELGDPLSSAGARAIAVVEGLGAQR